MLVFLHSQVIVRVIVDYKNKLQKNHALINRVTGATSEIEQKELLRISANSDIQATLLPVRSVGVQGDKRTYSYVVGLSTTSPEPNWQDMLFLAKIIPRILHNVNRVCYIFGEPVQYLITDITHTTLNTVVLAQLRQADAIANEVSTKIKQVNCDYNCISCQLDYYASGSVSENLTNARSSYTRTL